MFYALRLSAKFLRCNTCQKYLGSVS